MQQASPETVSGFCLSSYLVYRYVVEPGHAWTARVPAPYPEVQSLGCAPVDGAEEILGVLRAEVARLDRSRTGILLSGGIDSAILAALLGEGVRAYTIRFVAEGAVRDESEAAARYADAIGLDHRIVEVSWTEHEAHLDELMRNKGGPLHPVEVGLFCAARAARADGIDTLVVGNGADSTFGGLSKLLSRDWSFREFVKRYSFVDPALVLSNPADVSSAFEKFRVGPPEDDAIDVQGFLKVVHGIGIVQAFDNALSAAGTRACAPYELMRLAVPLDLERVRAGQSKYDLVEVFDRLYPTLEAPAKIAFARPMDVWMAEMPAPTRSEFRQDLDMEGLSAEQRWLVYCLQRFVERVL